MTPSDVSTIITIVCTLLPFYQLCTTFIRNERPGQIKRPLNAILKKKRGTCYLSGNLSGKPREVAAPRGVAFFSRAERLKAQSPSHGLYSPCAFPSKSTASVYQGSPYSQGRFTPSLQLLTAHHTMKNKRFICNA